jgi:hypothetical protein
MRNRLILIVVILAVVAGIAGFWYYQRNIYSKDILKLEILGPSEAELAQEIEYVVKYKNNGNTRLEDPLLIFECPENSLECLLKEKEETSQEKKSLRKNIPLPAIYPGEEKTFYIKARLLGKEGEIKTARAWLSYQPKNLKARYESETSHVSQIKSVPLTLEFDLPSKIQSSKEVRFQLNYFSNADYPLSDLGIKIEYPDDFEFQSAQPSALEETDWEIGLLNKAEGGRIEIVGNVKGDIGEQKQFKAELGSWQDGEFVLLKEAIRAVEIVTPALYISQQINNNPQYVASPGDTLHYELFFKNIGDESFNNLFLVARLEGDLFDLSTLKAPLGDFESGDNSIIFDWRRVSKLQFLGAREEGKVEFWVELKKDWAIASPQDKNQVLRNKVYLSQAQEEFVTKVNSKLVILQKGYFEEEVFGNSGPLPPEVGKPTTYTIIWQAQNYYNDVKNMRVRATLGSRVSLSGNIFPDDSRLTFDSGSREVVWEMEDLEAGRGILESGPSVAFQIVLTPKTSQQGTTPTLIGQARITGEDQFTGLGVSADASSINTTLPDDNTVSSQEGIVQ